MNLLEASHDRRVVNGFTLIELLLVVSLMTIVGTFMFPVGLSFYRTELLNEATEGLTSTLRRAQSFSLSAKHESAFGVRILADSYVLFEGPTYASRTIGEDESFPIASPIVMSGFNEVVFRELEGKPSISGVLIISAYNKEKSLEILPSGNIE